LKAGLPIFGNQDMANPVYTFFKKLLGKKADAAVYAAEMPEERISSAAAGDYAGLISGVIPYFNNLDAAGKEKFIQRVYSFRKAKRFHFSGMPEREEIAVLVSAAAVQVTFGLKNYLLAFFTDIYMLADAYHYKDARELYIGHVSPRGIYISWKYFVQGFSDYSDGINVALHEMAHALHHENFIEETGIDWDFREDFDQLPAVFGPIMSQAVIERKSYLRGYAFTNFKEFWAVSVEHFFEDPRGLKDNLPHLYSILCKTLNQDPLLMKRMKESGKKDQ
jgi:hypothetical protein